MANSSKLVQLLIVPASFYAGAKLSLALAVMPDSLVMMWLPNGVLLAALLHFGWRRFGYFALAVTLAEVAADYPTYTLVESILFAFINLSEAVMAMLLLRKLNFNPSFARPADLGKFLVAGPVFAAFAAACAAASMYRYFGEAQLSYLQYLRVWWFSDGLGLLIVTPFIFSLWPVGARQFVERVAFNWIDWTMAALGAAALGLFLAADNAMLFDWPIRPVLLLPFVVYAAARLTPQTTALLVMAVAAVVIFVTKDGHQPFGELPLEQIILQVQQFMLILALMSMGFSALLAQLRGYARQLERRVEERTTELRDANERLQQLAVTDPLTGVSNRRALFAALRREIERYRRRPRDLAVILFDIDSFKSINDRFGHAVGDDVLKRVAMAAAKNIRGVDMLSRYGGEEFAMVAPETDEAQARQLAERVREALRRLEITAHGATLNVTASFGVAMLNADDTEPETVLNRADSALYAAKAAGRDRVMMASGAAAA